MICWSTLGIFACITAAYLHYLNRRQAARRRALGKTAAVVDTSILSIKDAAKARAERDKHAIEKEESNEKEVTNDQAFDDLTDWQNEDFVYVL